MERRNLVIVALCVAIGIMAVAYASFSTRLNVNGTVASSSKFAVTFTGSGSCTVKTQVGADTPSGKWTATAGTTTATFSEIKLYTPGDELTCTIPVKNTGTLRAKYGSSTITPNTLTSSSTPIAISVASSTGTNAIAANGTSNIVVTIKYNWSGTGQPSTTSADFQINSRYEQAI